MKGWEDVVTEIYFVPDLVKGERGLPEIGEEKVTSFRPYFEEFGERLDRLVESIFKDGEFRECPDPTACMNCTFRNFCNK